MIDINVIQESGLDDTQSVITDIEEMSKQYIGPIDVLKSIFKPIQSNSVSATAQNIANVADVDVDNPPESRVHCFYRMIGFPVVEPGGSFYSPGYEPNSNKTADKKSKVNSKYLDNQALTLVINNREIFYRIRKNIFARQDINSTAYGIALRYIKTFSGYFDKGSIGIDPLKPDLQTFVVPERDVALLNFNQINNLTNTFSKQTHILRPFITNPLINETVNPLENRICVPFLNTKEDTKINVNSPPLKRPAIELILRLRLQQESDTDTYFYQQASGLINGTVLEGNNQNIKNTILAISGSDNLTQLKGNSAFLNNINGFSTVQTQTLNMLIIKIKGLIEQLDSSVRDLDVVSRQIEFLPKPDKQGPEFGGTINSNINSVYDQKIANLTLLDLNTTFQTKLINDRIGGGNELFASAVFASGQKNYKDEIKKIKRQKDDLSNRAIDNLANIERICGEVSGLGLIDVLAIYTALWAIDIESLLALLDDDSFNRLYDFNPELRSPEVNARKLNGSSITCLDALKNFEISLYNILSFADHILKQVGESPLDKSGTSIYG